MSINVLRGISCRIVDLNIHTAIQTSVIPLSIYSVSALLSMFACRYGGASLTLCCFLLYSIVILFNASLGVMSIECPDLEVPKLCSIPFVFFLSP